jgi:NADP-dependent 3-hydroxy acid dehydrogenase YdfG
MAELTGQVAIVTGASRGIGRAVAERLAAAGARLTLVGRSDEVHRVAAALPGALAIRADVADEDAVEALVRRTVEVHGGVDLLVNNAGQGAFRPVEETDLETWRRLFEVNVQGTFLCTRAVVPHMKARGRGTIVNVSSDVGRRTFANGGAYVATKYAVQGFSGCMAQELRPHGIRVTTINPGLVDTYFNDGSPGGHGRDWWLRAEDVADAVVYVAGAPPHMVVDELVMHPVRQDYPLG